jgi:uncharacterized HAD superfamily protein
MIKRDLYAMFFKLFFLLFIRTNNRKNDIYIFDIDNTISDTWPELLTSSQKIAYQNARPFDNVINLIERLYERDKVVFFLSARSYNYLDLTKKWLINNKIFRDNVFLVDNVNEKFWYLNKCKNFKIYYFDDLSYNHEHGEVKYYEQFIKKIEKLSNVKFYDHVKLKLIQQGEDYEI